MLSNLDVIKGKLDPGMYVKVIVAFGVHVLMVVEITNVEFEDTMKRMRQIENGADL